MLGPSELQLPGVSDPQALRHMPRQLVEDNDAMPHASTQDPMTDTQQVAQ